MLLTVKLAHLVVEDSHSPRGQLLQSFTKSKKT